MVRTSQTGDHSSCIETLREASMTLLVLGTKTTSETQTLRKQEAPQTLATNLKLGKN
jgi:hypothetical protein